MIIFKLIAYSRAIFSHAGLTINGLKIDFGAGHSILPQRIIKQQTEGTYTLGIKYKEIYGQAAYDAVQKKDKYKLTKYGYVQDDYGNYIRHDYGYCPLVIFYDSTIELSFSVELELSIDEGKIDIGPLFEDLLGDLDGVSIEIPATTKGYSSAHFRLDASLKIDMYDLSNSELVMELYSIGITGYETLWLGVYYIADVIYINAAVLGLPKMSITSFGIMTYLNTILKDIIGEFYNENVLPDAEDSSSEAGIASDAITANTANGEIDVSVLFDRRTLSVQVANTFIRWALGLVVIDKDSGLTIADLVSQHLIAGVGLDMRLEDGFNLDLNVALGFKGDRFTIIREDQEELAKNKFYAFDRNELGDYVLEDGVLRVIKPSEKVDALSRYTLNENTTLVEGKKKVYFDTYAEAEAAGNYVAYLSAAKSEANMEEYDMNLDLYVGIKNLNIAFNSVHEFKLTAEDIGEYSEVGELEHISLQEVIDITTLFKADSNIDLAEILTYFFPEVDADSIIAEITAESDSHGDIHRIIEAEINMDIKIAALMNYFRQVFTMGTANFNSDFSISDLISIIKAVLNKDDNLNVYQILDDVLSYINTSVVIRTRCGYDERTGQYTDTHNWISIFFVGGEFELLQENNFGVYGYKDDKTTFVDKEHRYSHYFKAADNNGPYYYNSDTKKYDLITENFE